MSVSLAVCPMCKQPSLLAVRSRISEHALVAIDDAGTALVSERPDTTQETQTDCRCSQCNWKGPMMFAQRQPLVTEGELTGDMKLVLSSMSRTFRYDPHDHEDSMDLIAATGLSEARLLTALVQLQVRGLASQIPSGLWEKDVPS